MTAANAPLISSTPPNKSLATFERGSARTALSSSCTRLCGRGNQRRYVVRALRVRWHEARKDANKLRYAAEFFRSLYSDKKSARRYKGFVGVMESLQDELGALNDLATGPEVLEQHNLSKHPGAEALVLHADKPVLISKAQAALDDVLDAKRFWQ